ncbi:ATP-binding cassette domain-containing protein [Cytophagaceae bacterium ABcell3]|nr:ATP-binding cassette domain-containing protein [Cytophagaceae bacterium ABcell3]
MLTINHINKSFGNLHVLNDVSLKICQGGIFGLLGPNGAGKTTLIRLITKILLPDSGNIRYKDNELKDEDVNRFGYLPEERGLYKKMQVQEHLVYLARLKGMSGKDAKKKSLEMLDKFGLTPWAKKNIENLSKGMQQKVQFIATVLHEPDLIILDEPFSGFDPVNAITIKEEIFELQKKGATIIYSTHRMETVEEMCDHIALINKSRIILEGEPEKIRKTYRQNIFALETDKKPDMHLDILEEEISKTGTWKGRVRWADTSPNHLLHEIMKSATVLAFNEELPGIHEIFIRSVKEA